jgi:hypothetical protein
MPGKLKRTLVFQKRVSLPPERSKGPNLSSTRIGMNHPLTLTAFPPASASQRARTMSQ